MQYKSIASSAVSRLGIGTKRFPVADTLHAVHLDESAALEMVEQARRGGISLFDTSYSHRKGEAEQFLGCALGDAVGETHVTTSFFEMVDPRYEYVFQKQMKKLGRPCIDFYHIEEVCDLNYRRDVDSGAVDFLFGRKEAGEIGALGFSSQLNADNLRLYLGLYPWDFVRMRINYVDWFTSGVQECFSVVREAGLPVIAHGTLRLGPTSRLRPQALAALNEAAPGRSMVDWGLRFAKSIEGVASVVCNARTSTQVAEAVSVFADDAVLDAGEFEVLAEVARMQRARPSR